MPMYLVIYTDGGSRSNPGPAAFGVYALDGEGNVVYQRGEYLGIATNNYAEYSGLLHALETAQALGATHVEVRMDSELIVRQMTGVYKIKEPTLKTLAAKARELMQAFREVTYVHVRREYNKDADRLVNEALDLAAGKSSKS